MIKKIQKIIEKYKLDFIINEKDSLRNNLDELILFVTGGRLPVDAIWEVRKLSKEIDVFEFLETEKGIRLKEEFTENGYRVEEGMIIWDSYIPIEMVRLNYNEIEFVDSDKFKKAGFGVTSFRIYLDLKILDVYCSGNHPNLNPDSKTFCMDNTITFRETTYTNVENYVKPMLGCVNLNFSYGFREREKIKELLNET